LKTLLLIRHAKSSWSDPALPDRERPLTARGRRAARKMGRRLAKRTARPDLIVASPAVRALKTARLIARRIGYPRREIGIREGLYACASADLLRTVQSLDDGLQRVMLVGHNPGIEAFARRLCRYITHMPTCAVAQLAFDTDSWANIGKAALLEMQFDCPKRDVNER
jgi:phosphohistidine phosphatase